MSTEKVAAEECHIRQSPSGLTLNLFLALAR